VWQKRESEFFFEAQYDGHGILQVRVHTDEDEVGEFQFTDDMVEPHGEKLTALMSQVKESYRRKGIATKVYDWVEKITGMPVVPSPDLSYEARHFWKKRLSRASFIKALEELSKR
jgi:GNAT superfamily N-acetyltransferase